jgi:hypothetical protein
LLEGDFRAAPLGNVARKDDHERPTTRIGIPNHLDSLAEFVHFPLRPLHQTTLCPIVGTGASTTADFDTQAMKALSDSIERHSYVTCPSRFP